MFNYQAESEECWGDTVPDYLMNQCCMPQLSEKNLVDGSAEKSNHYESYRVCFNRESR